MLKIIKNLINKYKPDKELTLRDKVKALKDITINPYKETYTITTFNDNIAEYIEDIKYVLDADLEHTYPNFKKITPIQIKDIYIFYFFSVNDQYLADSNAVFQEWLDLILKLLDIYEVAKLSMGKGYLYSNSLKLKPYILDIENIINTLYKRYVTVSSTKT